MNKETLKAKEKELLSGKERACDDMESQPTYCSQVAEETEGTNMGSRRAIISSYLSHDMENMNVIHLQNRGCLQKKKKKMSAMTPGKPESTPSHPS